MDGSTGHAAPRSDTGLPPVQLLLVLLASFHEQRITYCYWKSSRRLRAALTGESDLDLLISRDCQHRAQSILLACGFKCFPNVATRDHPAISSFLGFDKASGRIVHVHCHFRLVMGERLFKDYRIPWEEALLGRAVEHEFFPIRVLDPTDEALLLVMRFCLELRRMDPITWRNWTTIRSRFEFDRSWMAARLDRATVQARAAKLLSNGLADAVSGAVFDDQALHRLRRRIYSELTPQRVCNAFEARLRSCARSVLAAFGGLNERFLHRPRPWRRRAPGDGCVVAVLGVDGAVSPRW